MKIYHYHPITKEYIGEGVADESPLEPGVFLIPAYATDIPPKFKEGKATVFNKVWIHVDVEVVADMDVSGTRPSSESEYAKVNRRYNAIASKIEELIEKNKFQKTKIEELTLELETVKNKTNDSK